jgi:Big-like domain-containing protein/glycine rich protein
MMSRSHRRAGSRVLLRGALAAVTAAALGAGSAQALAAPAASTAPAASAVPAAGARPATPALPSGCSQSGGTVTCTFTSTGEHQLGVPTGVTSVTATVVGGQGGTDFGLSQPGGLGAIATGTLSVTPGQAIFAEVGILGGAAGSLFPGFQDSGAGGGESDVRTCPATGGQPCPAGSTLASRLLVAGGGGGSGDFGGTTGNAGTTGNGGNGAGGFGGKEDGGGGDGATSTTPGAGGAGCDGGDAGAPGAAAGGAGGAAGPANGVDGVSGGGGGAGWFGGGAGGSCSQPNDSAGSGGGGSSHAAASVTGASFSQSTAGKAPSVTISYTVLTITTASVPAGTVGAAYSTTLAAVAGTTPLTWSLAQGSSLPSGLSLSSDGTISGTPQAAGDFSFTVDVADSSAPEQTASQLFDLNIAKSQTSVSLSASPSSGATIADPVTLTADVPGVSGGPAATGSVAFSIDGTIVPGCGQVTVTAGAATCPAGIRPAGTHTLLASYSGDSNYLAGSDSITGYDISQATPGLSFAATPSSGATVASPISLSATVVPLAGGPDPTGTLTFLVDGTAPAGCTNVSLTAGAASCAVGTLPAGTYTLAASYSGDTNYLTATDDLTGYQVSKLASTVKVLPSIAAPVWGQSVSFTATVTAAGAPVTSGTVQWSVNGTAVGAGVAVGADGTASLGPLTGLPVGADQVTASYSGTDQDAVGAGTDNIVVGQAATSTSLAVSSKKLAATIAVVAPGAGEPSGTVTFAVNGAVVGTAPVSGAGIATLAFMSSGAEVVSASYGGDTDFMPSSASTSTRNPVITAKLTSAQAKTRYGWYRSPVTITFSCQAGSAPLTGPCPKPVVLSRSAAAQSVTRTIRGTDGGIATITVSPVNIDRDAPVVHVTGLTNGATYDAPGPSGAKCVASDGLSGLAGGCVLAVAVGAGHISWQATATDKAGNATTVHGSASLIDYYVADVPRAGGFWQVKIGHSYLVKAFVATTKAPRYVFAAPRGIQPHPVGPAMKKIGPGRWAIEVHITSAMRHHKFWTLGVDVGGQLHDINVELSS